jgi:hypothetical protein
MPSLYDFQESELIALIVAIPLFGAILTLCLKVFSWFTAAILASTIFAMGAVIFTVVEDITLAPVFNWLEHICYAFAGLFLGAGCYAASRPKVFHHEIDSR